MDVCTVLSGNSGGQVYKEALWGGFLPMGLVSIRGRHFVHTDGTEGGSKPNAVIISEVNRAGRGGWK